MDKLYELTNKLRWHGFQGSDAEPVLEQFYHEIGKPDNVGYWERVDYVYD